MNRFRTWPLRTYFLLLLAVFLAVAAASAAYIHVQTREDAEDAAHRHARFAAHVAAKDLADGLKLLRLTVVNVASNPAIGTVLTDPAAKAACTLSTTSGHVDIVGGDGVVECSSDRKALGRRYESAWFMQSQIKPTLAAPVRDPVTGRWSIAMGAPIKGSGGGVVEGVFDLEALAPELLAKYSGGEPFVFVVTDGKRVLARSLRPREAIGREVSAAAKARPEVADYTAVDRDGVTRFFASAPVPGTVWRFYAGVDYAAAVAPGVALERRQFGIILVGLVLMFVATWGVYVRTTRPLRDMQRALREGQTGAQVATEGGPREVNALGREINAVLDRAESEREQAKMEALGRLASGVAHDFNNVLAVIRSHAERMLRKPTIDERARGSVESIDKAATRGAQLTEQLLAFARQKALNPVPTDVNVAVREMTTMVARLIGRDIDVRTALSPGLPPILIDDGQLAQVLLNLALNARDAMPDGGVLSVTTEVVQLAEDDVVPGSYVELCVADTGVGMEPDVMERVFDPFFTTKGDHGTGLGLATVRSIVIASGGLLDVQSAVGMGTTFRLRFPSATDATFLQLAAEAQA